MSTITCPSCQAELDASLKFCTSCGARLLEAAVPPASVVTAVPAFAVAPIPPMPMGIAPIPIAPIAPPAPVAEVAPASAAPAPAAEVAPLVRRTRRSSPFLPPRVDEDDTPLISRAWAARAGRPTKPQLGRQRKMAGDLPAWDPLPPGEIVIKRTAKAT